MMGCLSWSVLGVFVLASLSLSTGSAAVVDDDLQFDENVELTTPLTPSTTAVPVRRLWGVPDFQAAVGKLFSAAIPTDAFSGDVDFFEPGAVKSRTWPAWLEMSRAGVMQGVPRAEDVGVHYLMVRAVGPHAHHYSKDIFAIEVIKPGLDTVLPDALNKDVCAPGVDPMMLTIVLDVELKTLTPAKRISIIQTIASYYALPQEIFYLRELPTSRDILLLADSTVVMAGPGNIKTAQDKEFASLSLQVGCGRKVRPELSSIIDRIRSDSKDGTLAEVLQEPVVGWHARNELPAFFRDRREAGSGDFYEEEDDEEDYGEPLTTLPTLHPHRHHHGEEDDLNRVGDNVSPGTITGSQIDMLEPSEVFYHRPSTSLLLNYDNIISTPPFIPERPTIISEFTTTVVPTRVTEIDLTPSVIARLQESTSETAGETKPVTIPILVTSNEGNATELTSESTADLSSFTHPQHKSSQTPSSSAATHDDGTTIDLTTDLGFNHTFTFAGTTEEIEPETRNFPPTISHRLKKVAVIAGKLLQFKIPDNTFRDVEDGSTSHLILSLKSMDGKPLPANSWIMFNESAREIIALPLENDVSKWEFLLEARDKDGDSVNDTFQLQVQQHKGTRTVNHELTLSLALSRQKFSHALDWQQRVLQGLTTVYGDVDSSQITVRSVSLQSDPVTFTWTNDSLPRSYCPRENIDSLVKAISIGDDGYPSSQLQEALGSDITVRQVKHRGIENCETKVMTPPPPPVKTSVNFAPVPRNQVDQINATAGQLLIYRVPEDTFYDPEDGGTRKLKMTLLNMDRSPLSVTHWVQFDTKNQEFYGLPMDKDVRSQEYQLVCEDKAGLTANDGLIVVVRPRIHLRYSVEFSIALDVSYESFIGNAALKRKFIEKLQELFGDSSPEAIVIGNITAGSTIVTWFNRSLPTDHCPEEDIHRLRRILINDNEMMSDRLVAVMGSELPVISVGLEPAGACQGELTVLHKPEPPASPADESHPLGGSTDDYLITFVIPVAVIALMLTLAGLIACLFYRKRRSSKMGIGDEDERQSFRSKGIPVIFQDELDEKPEPENKNPVIMKEEKPPLPPPEYQRVPGDDAPYHPPPPFPSSRDSGRQSRPKPTPTYRKPPPYVPP